MRDETAVVAGHVDPVGMGDQHHRGQAVGELLAAGHVAHEPAVQLQVTEAAAEQGAHPLPQRPLAERLVLEQRAGVGPADGGLGLQHAELARPHQGSGPRRRLVQRFEHGLRREMPRLRFAEPISVRRAAHVPVDESQDVAAVRGSHPPLGLLRRGGLSHLKAQPGDELGRPLAGDAVILEDESLGLAGNEAGGPRRHRPTRKGTGTGEATAMQTTTPSS